jgi:pectate lyase
MKIRIFLLLAFLVSISFTVAVGQKTAIAFPGAEGFARFTSGGRGGEIYHVTTLADSGPGSLRDAVSSGHRIVVFDVSGYIALQSILRVASDLTIAGQTAPGDGIATRNYEVSFTDVSNVVVRYLRFRQGVTRGQDRKSAVNITHAHDLIFDHVSIEWGRWDTVDMNESANVTLQNCIVGQGVAPQQFGCLCQCDHVTFSHNLFVNNHSRNPKAKGTIQYVNNVVYNWGVAGLVGGHSETNHFLDVIGNYFVAGQNSSGGFAAEFRPTDHVFQSGNYVDLNRDGQLNGRLVVADDFGEGAGAPTLIASSALGTPASVTIEPAAVAWSNVIAHAGCSLHRDPVDARLIADAQSLGTRGNAIRDPADAGGFGELKEVHATTPLKDSDVQKLLDLGAR